MMTGPITTIALLLTTCALLAVVMWLWQRLKTAKQTNDHSQQQLQQLTAQQVISDAAKADAEAANQAKNRYLSGISHELRTPLNVIMGYAQLLENQTEHNDPNKEKYTLMRHNCEHLAHLIEGILEFSAIESGKLKVQQDEFNMHELLDNLSLMFKTQAEQKGLKFETELAANMPKRVKADQKRLQQILINLLSNAIKFTDHGYIQFHTTFRNQVASFTIKDSGCGIKSDDLQRIFKPFERVQHDQKHVTGTGLGLSITQLLVDLLGGDIQVNSTPGAGSEFIFKIMLSAQTDVSETLTKEQPNQPDASHPGYTLLLVDDEPTHRDLIANILAPYGFNMLHAEHGEAAQQIVNNLADGEFIDLAMLDVSMPGMSGWELAAWLKQHAPATKIMMLSANPRDMESNQHQSHEAYLTKPIKINQLLNQLNLLLKLGWRQASPTPKHETKELQLTLNTEHITALLNMVDIGHISGIENYLQQLYADELLSEADYLHLLKPIKHANLNIFKQLIQHEST